MSMISFSNIKNALVVGPIYDRHELFGKIKDLSANFELVVLNGNALVPSDDLQNIKFAIKKINELLETNKIIYNLGAYDLKLLTMLDQNSIDIYKWISSKPNVISINFNNSPFLILNGGLKSNINTKNILNDNLEVSFISYIANKPWQVYYNGNIGYIISNNPLNNKPNFFAYSMQLGTKYLKNFDVYAQEISECGLMNLIKL